MNSHIRELESIEAEHIRKMNFEIRERLRLKAEREEWERMATCISSETIDDASQDSKRTER